MSSITAMSCGVGSRCIPSSRDLSLGAPSMSGAVDDDDVRRSDGLASPGGPVGANPEDGAERHRADRIRCLMLRL